MKDDTIALIGKTLPETTQRDAIHIAVCPAIAGESLDRGARVNLIDGKARATHRDWIGIIDPFLAIPAKPGDRVFVFLNPGSITSLRHHWEHPKINQEPAIGVDPDVAWLTKFADEVDLSYRALMAAADDWINHDDYHSIHFDTPGFVYDANEEFWARYERVRRTAVPNGKKRVFFSCSC